MLLDSIKGKMGDKPIQMLDYGAGKCRIWECMQQLSNADLRKERLEYIAYEPYPDNNLRRKFKLYTDFSDIYKSKQHFQVVVLMNVLHEIEVNQWEQPYGGNGYLVLQDEQVKLLFDDSHIINLRVNPKEKSNCWVLTKAQVANVTQKTIRKSINSLGANSYIALRTEYQRRIEGAHRTVDEHQKQLAARRYAFLSQQYINAILAGTMLSDDGSTEKSLIVPAFLMKKNDKWKAAVKI